MKIYVTGATSNKNLFETYKSIQATFSKLGHEVKPPIDTIEFCKTHNDKQRLDRALKEINDADFIIAEVSGPSSGQGFELGVLYAKSFKNIVLISTDIKKTSGILLGAFEKPIIYDNNNLSDLLATLQKKIRPFQIKKSNY